jgi:hypothetical protein
MEDDLKKNKNILDDLKKKNEKMKTTKKKYGKQPLKKSTKINLIGCDTIVNSPS